MQIFVRLLVSIMWAMFFSLLIGPLVIRITHRIKFNQPMYEYVTMHKKKAGTPTMGGIIFLFGILVSTLICMSGQNVLAIITLAVTFASAIIGFLDDFIKIYYKRNLGLRAYQKIISQILIAGIVAYFAYSSQYIGSSIYLPFSSLQINLGVFYIPFAIIVFLALTNCVNLTDGLDGLAGGVSVSFLVAFTSIFSIIFLKLIDVGIGLDLISEYNNLLLICGSGIGALVGYLLFNSNPASIFMGDTGSLALGSLLACLSLFTKLSLLIPILGIMFVVSGASVILQVINYKLTKKRIFLMAPFHHHLEKKGMNETKIVAIYIVITIFVGVVSVLLTALFY